jgi:thiamine-monophosphate kinase
LPLPEKALIARVRRLAGSSRRGNLIAGIGDDCAVLRIPAGHEALITTDFSLEGIHFRRDWHSPESIGHRCLTRGLSDIAAMGGEPIAAFLSLALPRKLPQAWVDRFTRGFLALADRTGVPLAGGDTAESPAGILADIVVLGSAPRGKAILRSGAKPGDALYVTGELGGSATALYCMKKNPRKKLRPQNYRRHFFPEPRLEVGRILRERGLASAMVDLSDGFSTDLAHLCEESGVGAEVHSSALPLATVGKPARRVDLRVALHGGEDYELLFSARPGKRMPARIAGVPLIRIGDITRPRQLVLIRRDGVRSELLPRGWEHFHQ